MWMKILLQNSLQRELPVFSSNISHEYKAIEEDIFSAELNSRFQHEGCSHPEVREEDIYENMVKAKKTDSVPGDIPSKVLIS